MDILEPSLCRYREISPAILYHSYPGRMDDQYKGMSVLHKIFVIATASSNNCIIEAKSCTFRTYLHMKLGADR